MTPKTSKSTNEHTQDLSAGKEEKVTTPVKVKKKPTLKKAPSKPVED